MKTKAVPSAWIYRSGLRLDSKPFLSGAIEARVIIESGRFPREPLRALTTGYNGGIFNGPQFSRRYVSSEHGVPFVGSSSMLMADLSNLPYLRKKDALSPKLSYLRLQPGMTLISCSGTIGRMVYVRPDMDGMWSSQHIMKVAADAEHIPPGYLYAFLSSRFGVPMVTSGTYGAIIQHIEPEHIGDLPVPRLGGEIESHTHAVMENAAFNKTTAAALRRESLNRLLERTGMPDLSTAGTPQSFGAFSVSSLALGRLDAAFYAKDCTAAAKILSDFAPARALGDTAAVYQTNIFKRPYVDDPQFGYPYYSGSELFTYGPEPRGYLRKAAPGIDAYLVKKDWLLMQDAGQLGGLIGRLMRVGKELDGSVVSNHLIRVVTSDRYDSAYLFSVLSSPVGYRAVVRNAFGTSIPQLESQHLARMVIPWPDAETRKYIADPIAQAWDLEDEALELERSAIAQVEQAIEDAA